MPRRAPSWAAFRPLGCSPLVRQRHAWAQACEGPFPSAHGHGSAGREPAGSWPAGTTAQAPPKPRGILRGRSCPSPRAMFDARLKPSLRLPASPRRCLLPCLLPACSHGQREQKNPLPATRRRAILQLHKAKPRQVAPKSPTPPRQL